jgi:hypothetical protein
MRAEQIEPTVPTWLIANKNEIKRMPRGGLVLYGDINGDNFMKLTQSRPPLKTSIFMAHSISIYALKQGHPIAGDRVAHALLPVRL